MRRLRLIAAMALARVAYRWPLWLPGGTAIEESAQRLAESALGNRARVQLGEVYWLSHRCWDDLQRDPFLYVSETGITRALAETEER